MKVVSIGDLVTDYYYKDGKLIGVNGGMTSHNIIANLAKMKIETAVYGVCGDDEQGKIAIKSLEDLKVNVENIKKLQNIKTRCFHVSYFENGEFTSKKRCPFCNTKKWYEESLIDPENIIKTVDKDDILVFDNLNNKNQIIIDKTLNKKVIDLGQYFELEKLTNEEIIKKLENKFEIINFNERVTKYLIKRFDLKTDIDLYNLIKPKFMTITRGENGATFIYEKEYNFKLKTKADIIDSTGAGDAFISSIIKDSIKNNFTYDPNLFEKWYENTNKLTSKIVTKMGARGKLYKIKKLNECTCETFEYKERRIKRCNININNLETRVLNAVNSKDIDKIENINFTEESNCLFIGTGGSYAPAYFASKLINELYGSNTYAMYPRDVLYRNNKKINKIILFSYSGTTSDIITSTQNLDKKNTYIITKGQFQNIVLKTGIQKKNIITYRAPSNQGREKGFLSFEGAVSPSAIFLKYYLKKTNSSIEINTFIKNSMQNWNEKISKIINKDTIKKMQETNLINIFRGDYSSTPVFDLESKITESGVFNCIIHEKKNFSHGRFINYENLNNNVSIYFKQKETSKYEEELLNYLSENTIIIESDYNGILAEFDLLIASQYIIYYIGKIINKDMSKPNYTENAMKIYFYKGQL